MQTSQEKPVLRAVDGKILAYHGAAGNSPGIIFCGGFRSSMTANKALAVERYCHHHGISFLRFDYRGHGKSAGCFTDYHLGDWIDDAEQILTTLSNGPQILVGSSMGAWIAMQICLRQRSRICGLLTIGAAADFTEHLIYAKLSPEQKKRAKSTGWLKIPSSFEPGGYDLRFSFIREARQHLLLNRPIEIDIPVVLLHGDADADVPWQISAQCLQRLRSTRAELKLIAGGDHRLSEPPQLVQIIAALDALYKQCQ